MKQSFSLLLLALAVVSCARGADGPCIPDREELLALDYMSFDQDLKGGWRAVSRREECRGEAADLIRDYADRHRQSLQPQFLRILRWHEGQERAEMGDYEAAVPLFQAARHPKPDDGYDRAWNLYASATVAFAERDLAALRAAYVQMLELAEPADWSEFGGGSEWPQNREAVEQLIGCFDEGYAEAYGNASCARGVRDSFSK